MEAYPFPRPPPTIDLLGTTTEKINNIIYMQTIIKLIGKCLNQKWLSFECYMHFNVSTTKIKLT
jgi:hypothetical protein